MCSRAAHAMMAARDTRWRALRPWSYRAQLLVLAVASALVGCAEDGAGTTDPPNLEPPQVEVIDVGLQLGSSVTVPMVVKSVACSTFTSCREELLYDPFLDRRSWTLTNGLACRSTDPGYAELLKDPFMTMSRELKCYDAGDLTDPTTWLPEQGHSVLPLVEQVFSGLVSPFADADYHLSTLLLDASSYAFCVHEVWGFFDVRPGDADRREATFIKNAPSASWRVLVEPVDDGYDCHLGPFDLSEVSLVSATGLVLGRPDNEVAGSFPVTRDVAAVLPATYRVQQGEVVRELTSLRLILSEATQFPAPDLGVPSVPTTRDFFVARPGGETADVRPRESCADVGRSGEIERVAVSLVERETGEHRGIVIIHAALFGEPFDCERADRVHCVAYSAEDAAALAPCTSEWPWR